MVIRMTGLQTQIACAMLAASLSLVGAGSATAQHACAPHSQISCGDSGCCEGCNATCESRYKTLDPYALFEHVAGDERLLGSFGKDQKGKFQYSAGGEVRYRFMDEQNRLRPPGAFNSNYDLWRITPYASLSYDDRVSGYVQAIDASAFGYDAPYFPLAIDVNRSDLLQYYIELNLGEFGGGSLKYRYGRQFLKYGNQRLISPLAWGNTYRNFEGHKLLYSNDEWDVDVFHMESVNGAAGGAGYRPRGFDQADDQRTISGVYSTYKGIDNNALDLYWLYFNHDRVVPGLHDGERHTIGGRLSGSQAIKECDKVVGTWAWDVEGAYQFGEDEFNGPTQDVRAGMVTANLGYTFNDAPWTPSVKGIFYWASGDTNRADGEINTFYTMYPLGHAWWGQIDNFSGQNLIDYCLQFGVKPNEMMNVDLQLHNFDLAESNDFIYNIAGAPIAASGASDIGQEIDVVVTTQVSKNFNVQTGYFWFFYGNALAAPRPDAKQFYLQTTWTF